MFRCLGLSSNLPQHPVEHGLLQCDTNVRIDFRNSDEHSVSMNPAATAPSARTLARQAYQRIRQDIVAGRLLPGSKLKLESLVQQYRIGMSPLREALARRVGDQPVNSLEQSGFWVAPLSLEELDDISRVRDRKSVV